MNSIPMIALAMASALLTAGCVTPTPYQPYRGEQAGGVHGGYSDHQLGPETFRVRFHGNALASRDRVEGFMLYRAAEVTLQQGYDWFLILDRHTEHDRETYIEPDPNYVPYYGAAYGWWRPHWRYSQGGAWVDWHPEYGRRFWSSDVDVRTVDSFEAEAEILLRRGPIPTSEVRAFDARKVKTDLEPSIERAST